MSVVRHVVLGLYLQKLSSDLSQQTLLGCLALFFFELLYIWVWWQHSLSFSCSTMGDWAAEQYLLGLRCLHLNPITISIVSIHVFTQLLLTPNMTSFSIMDLNRGNIAVPLHVLSLKFKPVTQWDQKELISATVWWFWCEYNQPITSL